MKLTLQQAADFERDGVVFLGKVLDDAEIVEARQRFQKIFDERLGTTDRGLRNLWAHPDKPEEQFKTPQRHYQMVNIWQHDEWYRSMLYRADLLDKVGSVLGPNLQLFHDQVFVKPARDGAFSGWHYDNSYWNYSPPNLASIWTTLDDTDLDNCCLHFLPGSHRQPPAPMKYYKLPSGVDANELIIDESKVRPFIMKAGEAVMHHCLTVHGAYANRSDRQRRALAIHYFAPGVRDAEGRLLDGPEDQRPLLRGKKVTEAEPVGASR